MALPEKKGQGCKWTCLMGWKSWGSRTLVMDVDDVIGSYMECEATFLKHT